MRELFKDRGKNPVVVKLPVWYNGMGCTLEGFSG